MTVEPTLTAIEQLEADLQRAMFASDVAALDELIADDLVFTMHTGLVVDKQYDLGAHRSGLFKFTKLEVSDRQLHAYGDCVVVTLKAEIAGIFDHQAFSELYCYTRVWVQRQNRWQIVAGHVSQLPPAQAEPDGARSPSHETIDNASPSQSQPQRSPTV